MEYSENKKEIILNRELNELDKFVLDFCEILGNDYVIVSGYVSILFGRSRATEDVDLLAPKMNMEEFYIVWEKITKKFECINTSDPKEAFDMLNEFAIRFCRKGKPVPNMEFKIIKNDIDEYSLKNKIDVIINQRKLFISPLEMQIAYKLYLSSEKGDKDIEDARHLYRLFLDKLNKEKLSSFISKLKAGSKFKWIE
ncbi:hypothetical protein M0R19_02530 [Candidatus Pacearchaeota archaeon]|jgi:hypothetical protein|nr:hypothetical protein [Candidatus Pacearchaeota archaeon]